MFQYAPKIKEQAMSKLYIKGIRGLPPGSRYTVLPSQGHKVYNHKDTQDNSIITKHFKIVLLHISH